MFDLDEGFHALQNLDAQGRKALVLAGKLWEEIYRDENQHVPASHIVSRYLTELAERSEEVRALRKRLDDVLDSREQAEIRAERAESVLQKARALATSWGLDDELDRELAGWRPHCRRIPPPKDHERPDRRDAELLSLRGRLRAAREAENVAVGEVEAMRDRMTKAVEAERRAFRIAEHQRDRALGAERRVDELHDEVGRLRTHLDF